MVEIFVTVKANLLTAGPVGVTNKTCGLNVANSQTKLMLSFILFFSFLNW